MADSRDGGPSDSMAGSKGEGNHILGLTLRKGGHPSQLLILREEIERVIYGRGR